MKIKSARRHILAARRISKDEGLTSLAIRALQKTQRNTEVAAAPKTKIQFLVDYHDVLKADWVNNKHPKPDKINSEQLTINWVMSPPGKGSGGHQNLFRFIRYAELAGHKCRVYLYSTVDKRTVSEIKDVLRDSYPKTQASIEWLDDKEMKPADILFATGWETAYPVFNSSLKAHRFYFVQDFEPYFYPIGSEYVLAENTYKFGFVGVTAGGWLAKKLNRDYGMQTDYFDFGAEKSLYKRINDKKRKEIFFYARPVTARRGFELGIMALELFHKKHPEYTINLAGWDVSNYDISFPHKNLSTLSLGELSGLYNKCSAALVMSLTNMSLLPLELLACGTIPVVNDGENNRLVSDNPNIAYVPNSPSALANKLSEIVSDSNQIEKSATAAASITNQDWDKSGKKFVEIIERHVRNG